MKSILFLAVLISLIAATWGITCYMCQGQGCDDPYEPTDGTDPSDRSGDYTTCSSSSTLPNNYCIKTVVGSEVTRRCGYNECSNKGCIGSTCTYCCEKNLCNVGNTVTTSLFAMSVALVAVIIFSRQ